MTKTRLTTTLAKLRKHDPCDGGWAKLLKSLPADYPQDKPINLLHILKSNGAQDTLWAFRALAKDKPRVRMAIGADIAARALKHMEKGTPLEKAALDCIEMCRQFVRGKRSLAALQQERGITVAAYVSKATAYGSYNPNYYAYAAAVGAAMGFPHCAREVAVLSVQAVSINRDNEIKAQAAIIRKYLK